MKDQCKSCSKKVDRVALERELQRIDISETAKRAAKNSVYCSFHCMLEDAACSA